MKFKTFIRVDMAGLKQKGKRQFPVSRSEFKQDVQSHFPG
jgi:hypothetical protein